MKYITEIQIDSDIALDLDSIKQMIMDGHEEAIKEGLKIAIYTKQRCISGKPKLCGNYDAFMSNGLPSYTCNGCRRWERIDVLSNDYVLEDETINCQNFKEVDKK